MNQMLPEGTTLIEIRGVYDGWSAAFLPDGTILNRWADMPGWDRQEAATAAWIDEHGDAVREAHHVV